MKDINLRLKWIFLALVSICLVSCGGGGSSSSSSPGSGSLSGTAATGAPMANATVTVYDSTGEVVGYTTTDSNGAYSLSIPPNFTAPFTVQVQGQAGEGSTTIYSVAPTTGVANINQVTHAIAAALSTTGDPATLTSGISKSAADITNADGAFSAALANLTNALGVTGSFITGTYNAAYDKLLDNVTIDSRPNAGTSITTSAGMQNGSNDFLDGATVTTAYTTTSLGKNTLPSGSDAANLPAFSASKTLAIADLETLRSKLEACFALSTSARGTAASPASACQGFESPDGDYLHDGYYWLDTSAGCPSGSNTNVFCQGLFGYMLTNGTYDNLKFLKPQIIRPLDGTGNLWLVKFPIQFSADNSLAAFGEAIGSSYIVVKKYSQVASGSDQGWRFYGNQRKVNSSIEANVQRIQNVFTGAVRYETGLNIYINSNPLRAVPSPYSANIYPTRVVVTDLSTDNPVLPTTGITLYNKGSNVSNHWQNSCGGFMSISQAASPTSCNGVIRLAYSMTGSYGISSSSDSYIAYWPNTVGTSTINGVSGYLSDTQINAIKPGQPFKFVITLSDNSTITYVNRVHFQPRNSQDVQSAAYPLFTQAAIDAMKAYLGTGGAFNVSWQPLSTSRPYSSAIYWQAGSYSQNHGLSQTEISANSASIPCTGSGANGCATSANWGGNSGGGTGNGRGLAQIRSRDGKGFQYFSQIRQY